MFLTVSVYPTVICCDDARILPQSDAVDRDGGDGKVAVRSWTKENV